MPIGVYVCPHPCHSLPRARSDNELRMRGLPSPRGVNPIVAPDIVDSAAYRTVPGVLDTSASDDASEGSSHDSPRRSRRLNERDL